jgi:hypothetical protein
MAMQRGKITIMAAEIIAISMSNTERRSSTGAFALLFRAPDEGHNARPEIAFKPVRDYRMTGLTNCNQPRRRALKRLAA